MSQRIEWIDIAKGGGMILVILEHSVFYGGLVSNVIMAVAMPLFFVLSGVVFNKNSKNVIAKRTKKLIVPYLVFCILGAILSILLPMWRKNINIRSVMLDFYLGAPESLNVSSIWFLMCMYWTSIVLYLVCKIKKKYLQIMVILSFVISGFVFANYRENISMLPNYRMPLDLDVVLIAVGFMFFGWNMQTVFKETLDKKRNMMCVCSTAFFVPAMLINKTVNFHGLNFGNIFLYIIESVSGSVMVICLCMMLQKCNLTLMCKIKKILVWIGQNTIVMLGTQAILIRLFVIIVNYCTKKNISLYCLTGIYQYVSFVFVLVFSILITYIWLVIKKGLTNE